jgi:serine/threonine-protein kinase
MKFISNSASPEFRQRMERVARAISSLNQPNMRHLYDIGSQGGTDYQVMEFLEGETPGERLRKGAMPLTGIFKVGIAEADQAGGSGEGRHEAERERCGLLLRG